MDTELGAAINRRRWICGCAGTILLSSCGGGSDESEPGEQPQVQARGCLSVSVSAAQASSNPSCGWPTSTSGNPGWDAAFRNEFNAQGNFWNIPGVVFAFLNDCNSPNAMANPNDRSILFGLTLAQKLLIDFRSEVPMWQVMAHEWGHQIQFHLGDNWLNAATVAPKELEADMFSGFYLAIAKNGYDTSSAIANAFSLGDWAINDRNHHGTPAQRANAVVAGARVALEFVSGAIPRSYSAVRSRFLQQLTQII